MVAFSRIADIAKRKMPAVLCIVTSTTGSTPRKAGARMVVTPVKDSFAIEGTIGGGAVENRIIQEALSALNAGTPREISIALSSEIGMCCGGQMTVYIEPIRDNPSAIILGAGHIGQAICKLAYDAGFDVTVADPRPEFIVESRLPGVDQRFDNYGDFELDRMPFGPDAFVVIVTHCHKTDQRLAEAVLSRNFRYAGLVGSLRKKMMTERRCLLKGIAKEKIEQLHCPAGLQIGAETPSEIALSIVSQMVCIRRANA